MAFPFFDFLQGVNSTGARNGTERTNAGARHGTDMGHEKLAVQTEAHSSKANYRIG